MKDYAKRQKCFLFFFFIYRSEFVDLVALISLLPLTVIVVVVMVVVVVVVDDDDAFLV